ncbi:MAG: hypothetical protein ACYC9O_18355 [Candidatus Latescibacterota bacterium]
MKKVSRLLIGAYFIVAILAYTAILSAQSNPYAAWNKGPSADPSYFPLAVWLQSPDNAGRYKAAGVNLYVGLWRGPTEEQLATLRAAGMRVVCTLNEVGLKYKDDSIIAAWMHGDEPDNAQSLGEGKGYGPPIAPEKIIGDYQKIKAADSSRPVLLNLGQSVAWDNYIGRGVRRNHPEDYIEYVKGGDIVSFDIYPVTSPYKEIKGNLWYVPAGVERLRGWAGEKRIVWNCIECTRISADIKATPHQVRAEVWMSLIHGSRGIIYFVHEWKPKFNEHALLDDPEMLGAVTALNAQIRELAPVLNSPTVISGAAVQSSNPETPVGTMMKRYKGETYLFGAGMRDGATKAVFSLKDISGSRTAEVIGESRKIPVRDGRFEDDFEPYGVHLYRIHK